MTPTGARATFGRLVRAPFGLLPPGLIVRVLFGPMRGMRWLPASSPNGAWLGRLERSQLERFIGRLRPGMTVWDVGANVGLYTVPAARAVGATGSVVAFEPIRRNVEFLRRHVELNGLAHVEIVESAVVESSGPIAMAPGDSPSEARVTAGGPWQVHGIALDDWRESRDRSMPAVLKIDVEGSEDRVLAGAARTLAAARPAIFLSLHGERQRDECHRALTSLGYRISSLTAGRSPSDSSEWLAEHA